MRACVWVSASVNIRDAPWQIFTPFLSVDIQPTTVSTGYFWFLQKQPEPFFSDTGGGKGGVRIQNIPSGNNWRPVGVFPLRRNASRAYADMTLVHTARLGRGFLARGAAVSPSLK